MRLDITLTFLELGDATSRNLAFSHRKNVSVSYGEETITETNILEIRRRHPEIVRVRTVPRHLEAKNGADWEWHIVGRRRTLKMRIQAKRIQSNGVLKVRHKVKSSQREQRSLLIDGARAAGMKAVYCVYCTERQRKLWRANRALPGFRNFETGCLLADADDVCIKTKSLDEIEDKCRPWHHLFTRGYLMQEGPKRVVSNEGIYLQNTSIMHPKLALLADDDVPAASDDLGWNAPTIDDLNNNLRRGFDRTGVEETTAEDLARLEPDIDSGMGVGRFDRERLRELGIGCMMVMDVRGGVEPEEREFRRGL